MADPQTVHATCVAWNGNAALIKGDAGQGKSALGLTLMGMGCALLADDRVKLHKIGNQVVGRCQDNIRGLIEARGIGILNADTIDQATIRLVVDLNETEQDRLPARRIVTLCDVDLPLIHRIDGPHFGPAILQFLKAGRSDR
jgi:HPr kinase/phosphorylase